MKIQDYLKCLHENSKSCVCTGILPETNKHDRARILQRLIFEPGSAALNKSPRDPIFIPFFKKYRDILAKYFLSNYKTKNIIDILTEIGKQEKDYILEEIFTKGHGDWRENTTQTKIAKSKSKNPIVRSHKDDIYQAEEYLIKSISYKVKS